MAANCLRLSAPWTLLTQETKGICPISPCLSQSRYHTKGGRPGDEQKTCTDRRKPSHAQSPALIYSRSVAPAAREGRKPAAGTYHTYQQNEATKGQGKGTLNPPLSGRQRCASFSSTQTKKVGDRGYSPLEWGQRWQ